MKKRKNLNPLLFLAGVLLLNPLSLILGRFFGNWMYKLEIETIFPVRYKIIVIGSTAISTFLLLSYTIKKKVIIQDIKLSIRERFLYNFFLLPVIGLPCVATTGFLCWCLLLNWNLKQANGTSVKKAIYNINEVRKINTGNRSIFGPQVIIRAGDEKGFITLRRPVNEYDYFNRIWQIEVKSVPGVLGFPILKALKSTSQ